MKHFLYIVRCVDESLYTGITKHLEHRIWQHNNSKNGAKSIRGKRPVKLVYSETYDTIQTALAREKEIKGWGKEKKEKLIALALRSAATKRA